MRDATQLRSRFKKIGVVDFIFGWPTRKEESYETCQIIYATASNDQFVCSVRIPLKANTDSEGNANGIPGRRRTVLGA